MTFEVWFKFLQDPTSNFYFISEVNDATNFYVSLIRIGYYYANGWFFDFFNNKYLAFLTYPTGGYSNWNYVAISYDEHNPTTTSVTVTYVLN